MPLDTWTVVEKDAPGPDGSVAVRIDLTGAGEPTKRIGYVIVGGTPNPVREMKTFIWSEANRKASKSSADLITVGMTGATNKPPDPAPPVPTPQEVWNAKVARYLAGKNLASTNVTAISDLNALFADINATYTTAFL